MGHYGGRTPKRHRGYTNNAWCSQVDLGVYSRALRGKKTVETVRRYLNKWKEGVRRHKGVEIHTVIALFGYIYMHAKVYMNLSSNHFTMHFHHPATQGLPTRICRTNTTPLPQVGREWRRQASG